MVQVAYGRHANSADAVDQCRRLLGNVDPKLLIAFCGGKHNGPATLAALRRAFGPDVAIVGGSAAGAIWRDGLGYSGLELGLAAFTTPDLIPQIVVAHGLDESEEATGRLLGERIAAIAAEGSVVL